MAQYGPTIYPSLTPPEPKIAIIGAGPAGLTLALLLRSKFHDIKVFDKRPELEKDSLTQHFYPAGSVNIYPAGANALKRCGLLNQFNSPDAAISCPRGYKLADKHGTIHDSLVADNTLHPLYTRNNLLSTLISCVKFNLNWKHQLVRVERTQYGGSVWTGAAMPQPTQANQRLRLHILDIEFNAMAENMFTMAKGPNVRPPNIGTMSEDFDIVIGADGTWSKVREQTMRQNPVCSGVHCITFTIPNPTRYYGESFNDLLSNGTYYAFEHRKGIICQRGFNKSVLLYLYFTDIQSGLSSTDMPDTFGYLEHYTGSVLENELMQDRCFGTWNERIKLLIHLAIKSDGDTRVGGKSYMYGPLHAFRPEDIRWPHVHGVTLIGDAAHVMTPFTGEGVNVAMQDAHELAKELHLEFQSGSRDWDAALQRYERKMFGRAIWMVQTEWGSMRRMFHQDAPRTSKQILRLANPPALFPPYTPGNITNVPDTDDSLGTDEDTDDTDYTSDAEMDV